MLYINNTRERKAKTIEKELTITTHQLFEQVNDQLNFVLDKAIKSKWQTRNCQMTSEVL